MGKNLYRNCPTHLTALYKHVGIKKEQEKYGSNCKKVFAREINQKGHNVKVAVGTKYKSSTLEVRSVCYCIKIALAFIPTTDSSRLLDW